MSKTLYEQLSDVTTVVADTGDIRSIEQFKPRDATTNPSLITAAAQMDDYRDIVDAALRRSREEVGDDVAAVVGRAIDRLAVEFGTVADALASRTTILGNQFLAFVNEPPARA